MAAIALVVASVLVASGRLGRSVGARCSSGKAARRAVASGRLRGKGTAARLARGPSRPLLVVRALRGGETVVGGRRIRGVRIITDVRRTGSSDPVAGARMVLATAIAQRAAGGARKATGARMTAGRAAGRSGRLRLSRK